MSCLSSSQPPTPTRQPGQGPAGVPREVASHSRPGFLSRKTEAAARSLPKLPSGEEERQAGERAAFTEVMGEAGSRCQV